MIRVGDRVSYVCLQAKRKKFIETTVIQILDDGVKVEGFDSILTWDKICTPF